jgi:hypothetical protein
MSYPACPGVSPLTVKAGQSIKTTVQWTNTGTETYKFDVLVIMGDFPDGPLYIIGLALDQQASPGQTITTTLTSGAVPSELIRAAAYDLFVAICDFDTSTRSIIGNPYAWCVTEGCITVTA